MLHCQTKNKQNSSCRVLLSINSPAVHGYDFTENSQFQLVSAGRPHVESRRAAASITRINVKMEDVSSRKYKFMKNCHKLRRDVSGRNYNAQSSGVSRPALGWGREMTDISGYFFYHPILRWFFALAPIYARPDRGKALRVNTCYTGYPRTGIKTEMKISNIQITKMTGGRWVWIWLPSLERFSTECRRTKTKVITLANHKGHRPDSGPSNTRSSFPHKARKTNESRLVLVYFWLDENPAWFFLSQSRSFVVATPVTFHDQMKTALYNQFYGFVIIAGLVPETVSRKEFQMKICIVLFVLVTLTTYCRGRTRWRMIEYDDKAVEETRAYKQCMRECKEICQGSDTCRAQKDPETLCRNGSDDGFKVDDKSFHGCGHLITTADQPEKPKRPFEVSDLWKLFEAK